MDGMSGDKSLYLWYVLVVVRSGLVWFLMGMYIKEIGIGDFFKCYIIG